MTREETLQVSVLTALRAAVEHVGESFQRIHETVGLSRFLVYVSRERRPIYVNPRFEEATGWTLRELGEVSGGFLLPVHIDDRATADEFRQRVGGDVIYGPMVVRVGRWPGGFMSVAWYASSLGGVFYAVGAAIADKPRSEPPVEGEP